MMRLLTAVLVLALHVAAVRAQAPSGPRLSLPVSLPASAALALLRQLGNAADEKGTAGPVVFDGKEDTIGFRVPVRQVTVSRTSGGLPGMKIRASLTVRCSIFVSYDLSRVKVCRNGLQLPSAKVVAAYRDPPGERGNMEYRCDFLRSDDLPWDQATLERLKYQLLEEALEEARAEYLRERHEKLEEEFEDSLERKLEALARRGSPDR